MANDIQSEPESKEKAKKIQGMNPYIKTLIIVLVIIAIIIVTLFLTSWIAGKNNSEIDTFTKLVNYIINQIR